MSFICGRIFFLHGAVHSETEHYDDDDQFTGYEQNRFFTFERQGDKIGSRIDYFLTSLPRHATHLFVDGNMMMVNQF